jgi:hypothetical protein
MRQHTSPNLVGAAIWSLLLIAIGAFVIAVVLAVAPLFGGGSQENFILFQLYGLRRGAMFRIAAGIGVLGTFAAIAIAVFRPGASRAAASLSAVAFGTFRAAGAVSTFFGNWPLFYWGLIAIVAVYVNWASLIETPWLVCLNPDSGGYFSFGLHRTIGYTLVVMGATSFFGTVDPLVPFQLNFFIVSFVFMAHAAARLFDSRLVGLAILALLLPNGSILLLRDMILTEPMFISMITLHLGVVLHMLRRYSPWLALAAGVTIGCAILIRPAGYSFLACIPMIAWLAGRYWRSGLLLGGGAAVFLLLAASTFNYLSFGLFATQSFGGLSLVGHVAHLIRADMKTSEPELAKRIDARTAPVRNELQDLRIPHDHWMRTMNVYNLLLWRHVYPEIVEEVDRRMPNGTPIEKQIEITRISSELAFSAIRNDPVAYVAQVVSHYYGIWTVSFVPYGTLGGHASECFDGTRRILINNPGVYERGVPIAPFLDPANASKFAGERDRIRPLDVYWLMITAFQVPVVLIGFMLSITFGIGLFLRDRLPTYALGVGYAAYAMQAYFALVVGVQAAIPRYAVVMEPYLVFVVVGGIAALLKILTSSAALRARLGFAA